MDLTQIVFAQHLSENQFVFDADAFDRAIQRAEKRRAFLQNLWSHCRAQLCKTSAYLSSAQKIAN